MPAVIIQLGYVVPANFISGAKSLPVIPFLRHSIIRQDVLAHSRIGGLFLLDFTTVSRFVRPVSCMFLALTGSRNMVLAMAH